MDRELWKTIKKEIKLREDAEPSLGPFLHSLISSQTDLLAAVASILSSKLHSDALSATDIRRFILEVYRECDHIETSLEEDLIFLKKMILLVITYQHLCSFIKVFLA